MYACVCLYMHACVCALLNYVSLNITCLILLQLIYIKFNIFKVTIILLCVTLYINFIILIFI